MKFSKSILFFVSVMLALTLGAAGAAAQDTRETAAPINQSDYQIRQVSLDKVYEAPQGYVIQYSTGLLSDKKVRIAIPYEWFDRSHQRTGTDGVKLPTKAELIQIGTGKLWPYLVVYYKGGEIDHVRLYVSKMATHPTWGYANSTPAVEKLFAEADNWKL